MRTIICCDKIEHEFITLEEQYRCNKCEMLIIWTTGHEKEYTNPTLDKFFK